MCIIANKVESVIQFATAPKVTSHWVTTPKHPIVCYRCGGSHLANHCRFIKAECRACGKKGHIATKVWRSKPTKASPFTKPNKLNLNYKLQQETARFGASFGIVQS